MPGPSKLEKVVDPGSGPQGPLPEIGVHYLNLDTASRNFLTNRIAKVTTGDKNLTIPIWKVTTGMSLWK